MPPNHHIFTFSDNWSCKMSQKIHLLTKRWLFGSKFGLITKLNAPHLADHVRHPCHVSNIPRHVSTSARWHLVHNKPGGHWELSGPHQSSPKRCLIPWGGHCFWFIILFLYINAPHGHTLFKYVILTKIKNNKQITIKNIKIVSFIRQSLLNYILICVYCMSFLC